jgi:threonine synthase
MKFKSTRGAEAPSFSEAFNQGLAPDGGLFVPELFPNISERLDFYSTLTYAELAAEFMFIFAEEINKDEWQKLTEQSYSSFSESAPDKIFLKEILNPSDTVDISVLELFHGPTLAFKDFALQLVGKLYERECLKSKKVYTILGATSGDTGSAAIYGVLGNPSINIFIMYPEGKIAPEQELQITTTGSANVFSISIAGTFDDAQAIVKDAFSDRVFAEKVGLAAVNSINIARILAQSIYYLFAYLKVKKKADESLNANSDKKRMRFIVPTGNFGNVLSGWFLNNMGLDCDFVLATNENDVLHSLWNTGEYKKKPAKETYAPSMDIQQASNFERLLYYMYDEDAEKVFKILSELKEKGIVHIDMSRAPKSISSISTNDSEIEDAIRIFYTQHGYILDPHTACAYKGIDPASRNIIVSTASPAKFPKVIEKCTGIIPKDEVLERLRTREKVFVSMGVDAEKIKEYILRTLALNI